MCTNQGFKSITPYNVEFVDYLYYTLIALTDSIISRASGTTFKEISGSEFARTIIPLPPLFEQKRIVEKIEELFPLVEAYGKAEVELATLDKNFPDALKKSILQWAVQGKLVEQLPEEGSAEDLLKQIRAEKEKLIKEGKIKRDKKSSEIIRRGNEFYEKYSDGTETLLTDLPFDIPESWTWCKLGEIAFFKIGKTPPRKDPVFWDKATYPWVSIADMNADSIIYETKERVNEFANTKVFSNRISPKGTLLMSFKLTVGKVSILGVDAFHNEAIVSIFPYIQDKDITKVYLFKILPLISKLGDFKDAIKGSTLNSESLYNLLLPLPPLNEQARIVRKIESSFRACL